VNTELIKKIEAVFAGVSPGAIGIRRAFAYDSRWNPGDLHEDPKLYREACEGDQREKDWREIPDELIAKAPVFPFFDDAGFKFVLPAVLHWGVRIDFDPARDRNFILEFLIYRLLPESRKADKPAVLAQRWKLTQDQIAVLLEWIDIYLSKTGKWLTPLKSQQLDRWKMLTK
jgi:hypothetical protein